jgi:hypothetical protein
MDEWFGLSIDDIRLLEDKTQMDLKEKIIQQAHQTIQTGTHGQPI